MNKQNNNALILFVKAPRMRQVKTRLQPQLSPEQSLLLYRAMVEDMVSQLKDVGFCDLKIFFTPADAIGEIKSWLGNQFEYFPQRGDDLGAKMYHAIAGMLHQNYPKAVLIGSDIPTLDSTTVVRALTTLDEYDVVIGPCKDGGYFLIGMKQPHAELFQGVAWSTNLVLQQTFQHAQTAKLEIMQLEHQSDIDNYADVLQLWRLFNEPNLTGAFFFKTKTFQVLKTFCEVDQAATHKENVRNLL